MKWPAIGSYVLVGTATAMVLVWAATGGRSRDSTGINIHRRSLAGPESQVQDSTRCLPPERRSQANVQPPDLSRYLAGDYALTVIATAGFKHDSLTRGRLRLSRTAGPPRAGSNPNYTYPAYGSAEIDLSSLGWTSIASESTLPDSIRSSVQALYSRSSGHLDLLLGGVIGPDVMSTDIGVEFNVFRLDSTGIYGFWRDVGLPRLNEALMAGYFCAFRALS